MWGGLSIFCVTLDVRDGNKICSGLEPLLWTILCSLLKRLSEGCEWAMTWTKQHMSWNMLREWVEQRLDQVGLQMLEGNWLMGFYFQVWKYNAERSVQRWGLLLLWKKRKIKIDLLFVEDNGTNKWKVPLKDMFEELLQYIKFTSCTS